MKLIRYFFVGGASAGVDFALFVSALIIFGEESWFAAAAMSFVVATSFNYALSIRVVFVAGARFSRTNEIILVFLVSLVGLLVNQAAMWLFYKVGGVHILISKCMATGVVFYWNFTTRNYFIFRELK